MYGKRPAASILPHPRCREGEFSGPPRAPHEAGETMTDSIRVGVIADLTGPLSFVGIANANVARMVIGDINARGGLLERHLELCVEDGATDDDAAAAAAAKLVEHDHVDVILGGIYSSARQAI